MKMRSRSNDTCQTDLNTFKSIHTPNLVDLLLLTTIDKWTMKDRHINFTFSFHTPNIVDLLSYNTNLNLDWLLIHYIYEVKVRWTFFYGHIHLAMQWSHTNISNITFLSCLYTIYDASRSSISWKKALYNSLLLHWGIIIPMSPCMWFSLQERQKSSTYKQSYKR